MTFFQNKLSLTHILSTVVGVISISLLALKSIVELSWWCVLFEVSGTYRMVLGALLVSVQIGFKLRNG